MHPTGMSWPFSRTSQHCIQNSDLRIPLINAPSDCPEASFFFRLATNPATANRLEPHLASRLFDWDRLVAFALRENAATILDDRLSRLPATFLPPEQRERIAKLGLVWTLKLKLLERRLHESVRLLSDAGIEVTLLKGAAIALTVYRRFEDRPMADIDLLVDPARASEAHELMQQNGWKLETGGYPLDAWDTHHHLPPLLDTSGSGLRLELHVGLLPPGHGFQFDLPALRTRSPVLDAEGIQASVPDLHMLAVHAAIHFAWCHKFMTGGTNVFRDLNAIERTADFSWEKFVALANQTRSQAACYWTLRLAKGLTDLAVPEAVLSTLAPSIGEPLLCVLERHFAQLALHSESACPSATLRHRLWAFALQADGSGTNQANQWDAAVAESASQTVRALRRVPAHARRIRAWSLYVTSMFAALPGMGG